MRVNTKTIAISCIIIVLLALCFPLSVSALNTEHAPLEVNGVVESLTENCQSTEEKAMAIYRYITRYYEYDYELCDAIKANKVTQHTPDPAQTLNSGKGICYDLAVLYADMLQSAGIRSKIVKGYFAETYHAWNSVYDAETGAWIQLDVTNDLWYGRNRSVWEEIDHNLYTVKSETMYMKF